MWKYKVIELHIPINSAKVEMTLNRLGSDGWEFCHERPLIGGIQLVFKQEYQHQSLDMMWNINEVHPQE